jgi:hypothetical protein
VLGKSLGISMIPEFNDDGYLPPGIHPSTLEELDARFGQEPEMRRAEMESLRWLVELAKKLGVLRILVDGSFVTEAWEPNDVDCVLLAGPRFPVDQSAAVEFMSIQNELQLQVTREKLSWLQQQYKEAEARPMDNSQVREWTLRSLKRMINQMTEEIVRYETRMKDALTGNAGRQRTQRPS